MAKRVKNTKIGDIFSVPINENYKKYIQYVISDLYMLNSDVIRAFKKEYPIHLNPDLSEIVKGEVEFYAHCDTKAGIKQELWELYGNISDIGQTNKIIFRDSWDYGHSKKEISNNWYVWKVGEEPINVGSLKGKYRKADIGLVFPVSDILERLKTGKYSGFYPNFE
jgi:hypothetical protein